MNDDSANKDIQYHLDGYKSKDKINYFVRVRKRFGSKAPNTKSGRKKLIIFIVLAILVCAGIVAAILLLTNRQNNDQGSISNEAQVQIEQYEEELSQYIFNNGSEEFYNELLNKLTSFIENNKDQPLATRGRVNLANLYFANRNYQLAADTLNDGLENEELTNQDKLSLLLLLMDIYEAAGQQTGLIDVVTQITQLPSDMELEHEDWPALQAHYKDKLKELTDAGN